MEPKPLTPERRSEIVRDYIDGSFLQKNDEPLACHIEDKYQGVLTEALAAEAYWREAVKNATPESKMEYEDSHYALCPWCAESEYEDHKPGCVWLIAQSG